MHMLILALISTVLLLVWMGFFMLGSLPLLVLKHDTPLDAHFIRGLFNVYYTALMFTASIGALSYAFASYAPIALVFGALAGLGFAGRHGLVPHMDKVRSTMSATNTPAIQRFRLLHVAGMLVNMLLLVAFCFGMTRVSL
jgi:hypothetical protein